MEDYKKIAAKVKEFEDLRFEHLIESYILQRVKQASSKAKLEMEKEMVSKGQEIRKISLENTKKLTETCCILYIGQLEYIL